MLQFEVLILLAPLWLIGHGRSHHLTQQHGRNHAIKSECSVLQRNLEANGVDPLPSPSCYFMHAHCYARLSFPGSKFESDDQSELNFNSWEMIPVRDGEFRNEFRLAFPLRRVISERSSAENGELFRDIIERNTKLLILVEMAF
jgi:hypothetical protein